MSAQAPALTNVPLPPRTDPTIVHANGASAPIESEMSDATRLLCASAITLGRNFRRRVRELRAKYPPRAVAPEPGVDVDLLTRVCAAAEARDDRYDLVFACVLLGAVLLWAADPRRDVAAMLLGWLAATVIAFWKSYREHKTLISLFTRASFDPALVRRRFAVDKTPDTRVDARGGTQNLVVYRGFSPFVGAGVDLGGWSFVVDLSRGKDGGAEPDPIGSDELRELYDRVETESAMLKLPGLAAQDVYFVHGRDIRHDPIILGGEFSRPTDYLPPVHARQYQGVSDLRIRHYLWLRVQAWGSELIVSYFVRFALSGKSLFVEVNQFVLPPLAPRHHQIDRNPPGRKPVIAGLIVAAPFVGPVNVIAAPLFVLGRVRRAIGSVTGREEREWRHAIERDPQYDYGAETSIRQSMSGKEFLHFFQRLDHIMYLKMIQRSLLDSVLDFLDEHHIDTSDVKDRTTTILNSGILVQGGDVKAENLAVGTGAQANTTKKGKSGE